MNRLEGIAHDIVRQGGVTLNLLTNVSPVKGYMVGDGMHEEVYDFDGTMHSVYFGLRRFVRHNGDALLEGAYLGAWISEGKVYFDLSERFDSADDALNAARVRGELSIFDLAAAESVPVTGGVPTRVA